VLPWNPDGYGPWSATTSFQIDASAVADMSDAANPMASPLSPTGPVGTLSPVFTWNPATGATWYQLAFEDINGQRREYWYTSAQACVATPCTATPGVVLLTYPVSWPTRWLVRAWTPSGHGLWSPALDFEPAHQPPNQVVPVKPTGTISTAAPSFTWQAQSNAYYYLSRITDRNNVRTEKWYRPAAVGCVSGQGTCVARLVMEIPPGQARWSVLAWNGAGYGLWSATTDVLVQAADRTASPAPPSGPVGPIPTRTPTYAWSPVADALAYELSVTDALGTVQAFSYAPGQVCAVSCTATPLVELPVGASQWRLRARTSLGWGGWTTPLDFSAFDGLPNKVVTVAPVGIVTSSTPTFSWNAVAGTYYLLRVVDRDNAVVDRWYQPAEAGCSGGTGVCHVALSGQRPVGPSTWSVIAWNGMGYGPWSDVIPFVVEIADPAAAIPQPIAPLGTLNTPHATYMWTRVPTAVLYRLAISSAGGQPTHTWHSATALGCAGAGTECGIQTTGLANGAATWQVQAWTAQGYGPWSALVDLLVVLPAPARPQALSPIGSSSATPTFTWTASQTAAMYYVVVDDATGNRVARWLTPLQAGCGSGTGTCTLSPGVVLLNGLGNWRVIAWNPSGYSPWSPTLAFTVQ
jgi:hypothetical protein